jgi:phenylpyruvate tautomerase
MPLISITTNQSVGAEAQAAFLQQLSAATATMLGKPESYVMAIFNERQQMLFAGSAGPLAYVELKSLGLPEKNTADYAALLCSLIKEELDIPPERTYIEFYAPERHMWGWSGRTF